MPALHARSAPRTIHGFEESAGIKALVMELVEGPTLEDRLARPARALPLSETLDIARQVADALEAAHEKGVYHRDLKPANIKVREDGPVKVLDFGLAKLAAPDSSDPQAVPLSQLPTLMTPAGTLSGVILGTAAYMAPEQARGKTVDKRADIWAFGCVLFEMLAGRRPFDAGDSISDAIVSMLTKEPDWRMLPETSPPALRRLVQRDLEKDPKRRLRDIGDARIEIAEALSADSVASPAVAAGDPRPRNDRSLSVTLGLLTVGILVGVVIGLRGVPFRSASQDASTSWKGTLLGGPNVAWTPRLSPDGTTLARSTAATESPSRPTART